jgi:hypothetical protein
MQIDLVRFTGYMDALKPRPFNVCYIRSPIEEIRPDVCPRAIVPSLITEKGRNSSGNLICFRQSVRVIKVVPARGELA